MVRTSFCNRRSNVQRYVCLTVIRNRADLKCHTEWCASNGLKTEPELLHCADLCFRYLLGAASRADLDARLRIHAELVVPKLFPDDLEAQAAYNKYLRQTRFASVGSAGYLKNDRKARSHTQYGQHELSKASMYNLNAEAIIKVLLVDGVQRRAFKNPMPAVEYLSGHSRDGRSLPESLPRSVEIIKARSPSLQAPRFALSGATPHHRLVVMGGKLTAWRALHVDADKYEYACAMTILLMHAVRLTIHASVIYVSYRHAFMRYATCTVGAC